MVSVAQSSRTPAFVVLCGAVAVLNVVGLVMVLSASSVVALANYGSAWYFFDRQVAWSLAGALVFVIASRREYRAWSPAAPILLGVAGLLLIAALVPGVGTVVDGSRRWLVYGPIRLQPSELAKLALLIAGAHLLARRRSRFGDISMWRPLVVWAGVFAGLVMLEPDLGSTLVLALIAFSLLFAAGIPRRALLRLSAGAAALTVVSAAVEPYRRARLLTFLHPGSDPSNTGYQLTQSLIALGDGRLAGVGLGAGRAKWRFLPNAHTDFIFAVIGEELGLIGTLAVIGLFAGFGFVGFRIARRAPDREGMLLAAGVTAWITGQAALNIGAVIGVLPVTGIPLPFVSVGGSSLVVNMFAVGLLANVARHPAGAS